MSIFGSSEQPQGLAALGLDLLAILAQTVTFLVLFFIQNLNIFNKKNLRNFLC